MARAGRAGSHPREKEQTQHKPRYRQTQSCRVSLDGLLTKLASVGEPSHGVSTEMLASCSCQCHRWRQSSSPLTRHQLARKDISSHIPQGNIKIRSQVRSAAYIANS